MGSNNIESEVKAWLDVILKEENLDNFCIKIVGNSEKGDGYSSDILFVSLEPTNGNNKDYNLVLKCSKRSQALKEQTPIKQSFLNEMYLYNTVLPEFTQFQLEKGITEPFNSVPKYYGSLETADMEIIVFENMKKLGYSLWEKKLPLTRKHIELVSSEYAKFHATAIAMKIQKPEQFEAMNSALKDLYEPLLESKTIDISALFGNSVDETCDLLKDELEEHILAKFRELRGKLTYIFKDMNREMTGTKVLLHGDCWSNNFLFKHALDNETVPLEVAILDWQGSRCSSPILDLSYFIFASISNEDLKDLDNILKYYYNSLNVYARKLGTDLDPIYPMEEFFEDWKKFCKYGILMGNFLHKICATDKDEVLDMGEAAEKGDSIVSVFDYDVKDTACFINRSKDFVKYVVENNLI